ncbi:MAG: DNA-processing protein DprA [Idiomarina sp.]|nr:DNA-processing protein DprA [Idiomarina sp.]
MWERESIRDWLSWHFAPAKIKRGIANYWQGEEPRDWREPFEEVPKVWRKQLEPVTNAVLNATEYWLAESDQHQWWVRGMPDLPTVLGECDPPIWGLFLDGRQELLAKPQVAIVGSRNASTTAISYAESFAQELARSGLVITSGMAMGIDSAAHRGALAVQGGTVAILGCGIDRCYPPRAQRLAAEIREYGLMVSEYPPGTAAKTEHFPLRNRIISGVSMGVFVVAAVMRSGSLITARLAMEQGRDVYALPAAPHDQGGRGCNWLIQHGAKLVTCAADILDECALSLGGVTDTQEMTQQEIFPTGLAKPEMLANVGFETTPFEVVVQRSEMSVAQVMNELLGLELDGWIKAVPGGYVRLRR